MSLRTRIFLAMAAVATASVGVTALTTRGGVQRVVEAYVLGTPSEVAGGIGAEIEGLTTDLEAGWAENRDFTGAVARLGAFNAEVDRGVVLLDAGGEIVATAGVSPDSIRLGPSTADGTIEIEFPAPDGGRRRLRGGSTLRTAEGDEVGRLVVLPAGELREMIDRRTPVRAIDRRIAIAAALALGLALLAALVVSRQISRPVTRLAGATLRLAQGDRSERIRSERSDEVGQLVDAFNHLADSLETSEGLRRRLVSDVAHELRTPLAGLQANIEAMLDGLVDPREEGLEALHQDVAHLASLVADLQELAMAESGELRLDLEEVDLGAEVDRVAKALGLAGDGAARAPVFERTGDELSVSADPGRIRQVLTNLISNAARHGRADSIRVHLERRRGSAVLEVRDDGAGIDPTDLPHIFERLYRADTRAAGRSGSGLGLAITRELVRAHGGTVEVESEFEVGTTFRVILP